MAQTINEAAEVRKTILAPIVRSGEAISIPEGISIAETISILKAKQEEEEQVTTFAEQFDAFIWEGCFALANALDRKFGWFQQMKTPGSFFEPDQPPRLFTIKTGPEETVEVPWGRFSVPGIGKGDGYMETGYHRNPSGMVCFQLAAQIKRKHSLLFRELCKEIHAQLKAASLYKGKAVTIKFRDEDGEEINFPEPAFPRIVPIAANQLIFSRHIEAALAANLYTPLVKTARVRKEGIPLKRGVLLAGPYGAGKTLIATRTAALATENGWTFLFCQSAADFSDCVRFAQKYQPAVVFCEDIDRVTDGDRDEQMDEILNVIDGVDSKSSEIMLVLTTNEVENIYQGMLRPGRMDAVIAVERPDAEAVERLIRHYAGALLEKEEDLTEAGKLLSGSTPAVIREVVERAKLTALARDEESELHLTEEALVLSARTMRVQLDLLNRETRKDPEPMEVFGRVLAEHIVEGAKKAHLAAPDVYKSLPAVGEKPSNGRAYENAS
jgi:transitional endoplasmic reticulum ATPase